MQRFNGMLLAVFLISGLMAIPAYADSTVPETGQTRCFDGGGTEIICDGTGQDGDLRKGVKWPSPRLINNGNGTVTDQLTQLTWLRSPLYCFQNNWVATLNFAQTLQHGMCGLSDGSSPGDWRVPNAKELLSLVSYGRSTPALPEGHPFLPSGLQAGWYWSSTTHFPSTSEALYLELNDGTINNQGKGSTSPRLWAVRDAPPPPTQCSDGIDNDGDGSIDLDDNQCRNADQNSEKHPNR